MSDPERAEPTDFERWLLHAGKGEKPSRVLQRRMRRGLGLSSFGVGAAWAAVGIGALGLALGAGALWWRQSPAQTRAIRSATAPAVPTLSAPTPSPQVAPTTPSSALPAPQPSSPARPRIATTASAPASDGVRDEISLLDATRAALRAGKADAALTLLNRYALRHPSGVLAPEATALREKALAAAGTKPSAPK